VIFTRIFLLSSKYRNLLMAFFANFYVADLLKLFLRGHALN
jgi:hypothetical protein